MGSVMSYVECPQCRRPAFNDFYYRTGEEYTMCFSCGYRHKIVALRDRKSGNGRKLKLRKDGRPIYREYERMGAGCLKVRGEKAAELIAPPPNTNWDKIAKEYQIVMTQPDVNEEESYLVRWHADRKEFEVLFGNPDLSLFSDVFGEAEAKPATN